MSALGGRAAKVTRQVNPQRIFPKLPAAQIGSGPEGVTLVTAFTNAGQPTANLIAGSASVAGNATVTWGGQSAGFAVCAVKAYDGVSGSTAPSYGTASLSGCGMTWSIAGGPYAGHAVDSPDAYDVLWVFTGTGSIANGVLTFNIGTTSNARNLVIMGLVAAFANVDSIIETVDDGPSGTGAPATATLSDPRGNAASIAVDGWTIPNSGGSHTATPGNTFLGAFLMQMGFDSPAYEFSEEEIVSDGQSVSWLTQVSALS